MVRNFRAAQDRVTRGSGDAGFGLIELIVGALLLLIVMAGFVPVFLQGLNQSSSARFRSMATNIAREKIEQIRQLDYREVVQDESDPGNPRNLSMRFGDEVTVPERAMTFQVSYDVEDDAMPGEAVKGVQVSVTWEAPPLPSPAVVKTMVAQQYLGPRGALLEVDPTDVDDTPAPGTPFPLLYTDRATTVKYHIADSDWFMAYDSLTPPLPLPNDISLVSQLRDDNGGIVGKVTYDNSALARTLSGTPVAVSDIWFEYTLDASTIPDGYWDLMVTMLNKYEEPGNTWILRVRVEKGAPDAPTDFTATVMSDTQVVLSWVPGTERDRVRYVLERQKQNPDGTWPAEWTTVAADLAPDTASYTDTGVAGSADPWGPPSPSPANLYRYRIYGVDTGGLSEPDSLEHAAVTGNVTLPPETPPLLVAVPSVIGLTLTDAQASLGVAVLTWSVTEEVNAAYAPDTVLTQNPAAGTLVSSGANVAISVAISAPPPSLSYTVTITKAKNPAKTIVVLDEENNVEYSGTLKKNTPVVLTLPNGHYTVHLNSASGQQLMDFSVSGADLSLQIQ